MLSYAIIYTYRYEAAVGVGVFKLFMTILSASLVENPKFGRRSLLLYGNAGMTASLAGLSGTCLMLVYERHAARCMNGWLPCPKKGQKGMGYAKY